MADSFMKLHALGMCYRDINYGNFFFHPKTGEIRIADTDNVDVNLKPGSILGTPWFMAPEVVRRETLPNSMTDRYSMAVLLFNLLMIGHPLKGRRENELPYLDQDRDGSHRLCCVDPVFVFDPNNESNRPVAGIHTGVLNYWPVFPESLHALFITTFTQGLSDPEARVMDKEWRKELSGLRDSIFECPKCEAENFFVVDRVKRRLPLNACWSCGQVPEPPARMRITGAHGAKLVMMSRGAQLFAHHLEGDEYNFMAPLAEVTGDPLALKNLSRRSWTAKLADGSSFEVPAGGSLKLSEGCKVHFGLADAEIKL
jgi:serine/threonine protein kinase